MMTDRELGVEQRSYRTLVNDVSVFVTHTLFMHSDDRVEVSDEDGKVLLTFQADCHVLDDKGEHCGYCRTTDGDHWIFVGDGRCSGLVVTSSRKVLINCEYDFVPDILRHLTCKKEAS